MKAKRNIGIIKHLNRFLPLVRSHLDYCDIIYHSPSIMNQPPFGMSLNSLMEKVERVQFLAALAVTGTWKGSSRMKLYDELGWESLSDRRWVRRLSVFFKISHGMTPSYLSEHIPMRNETNMALRDRLNIPPLTKTERYKNSFSHSL